MNQDLLNWSAQQGALAHIAVRLVTPPELCSTVLIYHICQQLTRFQFNWFCSGRLGFDNAIKKE